MKIQLIFCHVLALVVVYTVSLRRSNRSKMYTKVQTTCTAAFMSGPSVVCNQVQESDYITKNDPVFSKFYV